MEPDSKVAPTHVNAYKAELAEKEAQHAALGGEIETLRETVATMEQGEKSAEEAQDEQPALAVPENEDTPSVEPSAPAQEPADEPADEVVAADEVKVDDTVVTEGDPEPATAPELPEAAPEPAEEPAPVATNEQV